MGYGPIVSMKKLVLVSLVWAAFAAISCGPKDGGTPSTPMGDSAPEFSGDLKTFTVGYWNESIGGEANPNRTWIFKDDGTFVFHTEDDWRAGGTWTVTDNVVMLDYKTMDGMSWTDARAKAQQEEEGGSQGAVARSIGMEWVWTKLPDMNKFKLAEDKKRLEYWNGIQEQPDQPQDPNAPPADTGMDLGSMMSGIKPFELERLK
jgi:hypothetical protein